MQIERSQKADSFLGNLARWFGVFVLWFLWESMLRVVTSHQDWNTWQTARYMAINVLYGAVWSIVLGTVHGLLLRTRLKKFLVPPIAVCVAMLVAIPILFAFRNYLTQTQIPMPYRWLSAALIFVALYGGIRFLWTRRWMELRFWRSRALATVLVVIPIVVALVFSSIRDRRPSEIARGPIRHVVLISIDTLRYDYVSAYGTSFAKTPVMDQVAAEGALFQNAIAPISLTGPSHISMFTGQSPLIHGVFFSGQPLSSKATTVTKRLRNAGFRTGGFISGYTMKTINCGLDKGFQVYDETLSWIDFFNETYYGRIADTVPFFSLGIWRQAGEVTNAALEWLETNFDRPFFLFVHYYDPHYPYGRKSDARHFRASLHIVATPEDVDSQKRLYAKEVESVDTQIGRIVEFLKRSGIYDQTLLLITADHGESLGEHGYYYGHGFYVYEQLMRVPMMLRCPALVKAGTVVEQQVALQDIHKTILSAAGLKPAAEVGGFDLLQVVQEPSIVSERVILSHNFVSSRHGIRTQKWKLIKNAGKSAGYELYDLQTDPGETQNLYDKRHETFVELKHSLEKLMLSPFEIGGKSRPEDLSAEQIERLESLGYLN